MAVLLFDLDKFKQVNDTLGHGAGDVLLHMVACRLKGLAMDSDTLARLGGDEFVLLLADLENKRDVPHTGQMLIDQLSTPFEVDGEEVFVTPVSVRPSTRRMRATRKTCRGWLTATYGSGKWSQRLPPLRPRDEPARRSRLRRKDCGTRSNAE
ncbi:MAG: GGDEF domain-containing protein [Propionivibrio sp.]|nr:GGDEF domain-containing protein [Propionivibrio sp.]